MSEIQFISVPVEKYDQLLAASGDAEGWPKERERLAKSLNEVTKERNRLELDVEMLRGEVKAFEAEAGKLELELVGILRLVRPYYDKSRNKPDEREVLGAVSQAVKTIEVQNQIIAQYHEPLMALRQISEDPHAAFQRILKEHKESTSFRDDVQDQLFCVTETGEFPLDTLRRILSEREKSKAKFESEAKSADRALAELTSWKAKHSDLIYARRMLDLLNGEQLDSAANCFPFYQSTQEQLVQMAVDGHRSTATLSDRNKLLKEELDWYRKTQERLKTEAKERAGRARNQTAQIVLDLSGIVASDMTHKQKDQALHRLFSKIAELRGIYLEFENVFNVSESRDEIPF